jgi:hypothetical protein
MTTYTNALIASTRMYNAVPAAASAWRRLFERVIEESGIALRIVEHAHPATLSSLWGRPDLGCAFMCGWPLALERGRRPVIAAPIPQGEAEPLVGSAALPEEDRMRLQATLCGLSADETGRTLLADVCLAGFAPATLADYDETLSVGR